MSDTDTQRTKASPRWRLMAGLAVLAILQLVSYQNCGSDFVVKDGITLASSASVCEASLQAEFQSSYQSFLKTNCAACHAGAGPGNGAFAANDSGVAFNAFLTTGSAKIDSNAVNSAHAGGYTGPQNSSAITLASQQWAAAEAQCKSGDGGSTSGSEVITRAKLMSATATAKDIVWNLDSELASGTGSTGGATLTVAVAQMPSANGTPVYYFSNPRLKGGTKAVGIKGMMIRINGQEQTLGTTWSRVTATAAAGATVVLSTQQILLQYDNAVASDTAAIAIDSVTAP